MFVDYYNHIQLNPYRCQQFRYVKLLSNPMKSPKNPSKSHDIPHIITMFIDYVIYYRV